MEDNPEGAGAVAAAKVILQQQKSASTVLAPSMTLAALF